MNKLIAALAAVAALLAFAPPVAADQAVPGDGAVQVRFSDYLERLIPSIDRMERQREKRFRKYRVDTLSPIQTARRFTETGFPSVKWAAETLVADIDDYGIRSLLTAMLRENLRRAAPQGFDGAIRVTLDRIRVNNYSVAVMSGGVTYARGTIEKLDPVSGAVIESHDVVANLSVHFTVDPGYDGNDFAFSEDDSENRIGPILAEFAKKALGKLMPDDAMADPVLVLVSSINR